MNLDAIITGPAVTNPHRQPATYLHQIHGLPGTRTHSEWTRLAKKALRMWKQGADSIPGRRACVDLAYYTTAARYLKTKRKEYLWLCEKMQYPNQLIM